MPLITDPDYLSQGNTTSWTSTGFGQTAIPLTITVGPGGATSPNATFTNATSTTLPNIQQWGYFEIRGAASANNNGLYQVERELTANESWDVRKVAGSAGNLTTAAIDSSTVILGGDGVQGNTIGGAPNVNATGKSVYFDTYQKKVWLITQGNVIDSGTAPNNGVSWQTLYSFAKEEWKDDPYLIKFDFPFTAITPEQFEIGSGTATGWRFFANTITTSAKFDGIDGNGRKTKELLRTGGWREYLTDGTTVAQEYVGVVSLGTFENDADLAYFQQGDDPTDTAAAENVIFTGAVNEAVLTYDYINYPNTSISVSVTDANTLTRSAGTWNGDGYQVGGKVVVVTSSFGNEGTYTIESITNTGTELNVIGAAAFSGTGTDANFTSAVDNRNVLTLRLRANTTISESKSFAATSLADIGVTTLTNQVYRFPLTNALDIDIVSGADVTTSPYDVVNVKYFETPFKARVDSLDNTAPLREFGIVVDSGTYTGVNGSLNGTSTLTTQDGKIPGTFGSGDKLFIYNGTANTYAAPGNGGPYTVNSTTPTTVVISGSFNNSPTESGLSFTLVPATAPTATLQQIYTKIQYQLRQTSDINQYNTVTANSVVGRTADELMNFVGAELNLGTDIPTNPNGGGSGVFLQGYLSTQVNDLTFYDNTGTARIFPATISIILNFNDNLTDDQVAGGAVDYSKYWAFYEYTRRITGTINVTSASGSDCTLTSSGLFTRTRGVELQAGDYIRLDGFSNSNNNGIYRITAWTDASNINVTKTDGSNPTNETGSGDETLDEDPIDTPNAIIVEESTANSPITGDTDGSQKTFSYAYDTNTQGSRQGATGEPTPSAGSSGKNVNILVRSIGLEKGQFVESAATALGDGASDVTITLTAALERNYLNAV